MFQKFHQALVDSAEAIINPVALLLSCGLLIYFYINITDTGMFKVVFSVAAVYVDLLAWLTWGRAYTYSKMAEEAKDDKLAQKYKARAFGLRICTLIYLILCSGPADISFFMSELNVKEQAAQTIAFNDNSARNRIAAIDALTTTYNKQLAREADTGFGWRSQEITTKLDNLAKERMELSEALKAPAEASKKVFTNPFQGLAGVLGIPANVLKVIAFAVLVFMIQLGLLLTPWEVKIKTSLKAPENLSEVSEAFKTPQPETDPEFFKFINAAYKTMDGAPGPLRGDQAISDITGIPLERCAEYKNVLCRTRVFDRPLLKKRPGVCETDFSKSEMLEHIKRGLKGVV